MSVSILLDQAQARVYAHAGQWDDFATQVALVAKQRSLSPIAVGGNEWLMELWFEIALAKKNELLLDYSHWLLNNRQNGTYALPALSKLMNIVSEKTQLQWILHDPDWRDLLVASTNVPAPNKEWRALHKVVSDIVPKYTAWMLAQPTQVQELQKAYLEKYGSAALHTKTLLYHAICAYGTPTKEQTRAAALSPTPIYDMVRLEEHYPGVTGLRAACEGMGMKPADIRLTLGKFMDGNVTPAPMAIPEHGFEHS